MKKYIIPVAIMVVVVVGVVSFKLFKSAPKPVAGTCRNFGEAKVKLEKKTISVAVADTVEERTHGLSDCPSMPAESGMYFVFPEAKPTAFWMKDMKFPLDIIWVADGKVTGVVENAPVPSSEVSDAKLPQYFSPKNVTGVLELQAGKAKEYGLKEGTKVELEK